MVHRDQAQSVTIEFDAVPIHFEREKERKQQQHASLYLISFLYYFHTFACAIILVFDILRSRSSLHRAIFICNDLVEQMVIIFVSQRQTILLCTYFYNAY